MARDGGLHRILGMRLHVARLVLVDLGGQHGVAPLQFVVLQRQQRRARRHERIVRRLALADEAGHRRAHLGRRRHPDHALGIGRGRHGHGARQSGRRQHAERGDGIGPPPARLDLRVGEQLPRQPPQRHDDGVQDGPAGQQDAEEKELPRHQEDGQEHDEHAIDEGQQRIAHEPPLLAPAGARRLDGGQAQHVALEQIPEPGIGALPQVGNLDGVRQHVVAVIAQQGIAVHEERGHAAQDDDVVGHGPSQARLQLRPGDHGQRRQEQLHQDARRPHQHAPALVGEAGRRRRVHIGNGHQQQEHQPDLVDLAAARLDRAGVAQLVDGLDQRIHQRHGQHIAGREYLVPDVVRQRLPVHGAQRSAVEHHGQPQQPAHPGEQPAVVRQRGAQPAVGIEQRQLERAGIADVLLDLLRALAATALHQVAHVRRAIGHQHVGAVQLGHQADDLVLRHGVVIQLSAGDLPDLLHAAASIHQADQQVGLGRVAVEFAVALVLHHIPDLPPVGVALDVDVRAQARPQRADAVPGIAVEGGGRHVPLPTRTRPTTSGAASP